LEILNDIVPLFLFLFENKFTQIGSPIRGDVSKIREKYKEPQFDSKLISVEIFKIIALDQRKINVLIQEFEPKAFSLENIEKINILNKNLMNSLEKQKLVLRKDWLFLTQIFLFLGQITALEFENLKCRFEATKIINGFLF